MTAQAKQVMMAVPSGNNYQSLIAQLESTLAQLKEAVREREIDTEVERPVTAGEAMKWMGVSKSKFYNLVNAGVIKPHAAQFGAPLYFKSEITSALKAS